MFWQWPALRIQLNRWKLLPRPERLTEFYFTDPTALPAILPSDRPYDVKFTVRNLERESTTYRYTILARDVTQGSADALANGSFRLTSGQELATGRSVNIPPFAKRTSLEVHLRYEGANGDNSRRGWQTQVINCWVGTSAAVAQNGQDRI